MLCVVNTGEDDAAAQALGSLSLVEPAFWTNGSRHFRGTPFRTGKGLFTASAISAISFRIWIMQNRVGRGALERLTGGSRLAHRSPQFLDKACLTAIDCIRLYGAALSGGLGAEGV